MNCLAQTKKFKNKHPAWSDPNDKKKSHAEIAKPTEDEDQPQPGEDGSSDDDDFDMYANDVRSKKFTLETKVLRYKHLLDINNDRSFTGGVQQVQFNPKSKMALVALRSGQVDLFEIDGERNRYIQNIKLPRTKEPFCSFKPDGNSIVICSGSYKGTFFTYDMISGEVKSYFAKVGLDSKIVTDFAIHGDYMACRKEGSQEINVLSSKTYENTFSVKLNEPAIAIQFKGTNEMYVAGENAHVYVWDLRKTSLCKHKFQDDGSVHSASLAVSESSNLLSVGSDSGTVNSYELDQCMLSKFPLPVRTYSNLKTKVDILRYNASGELLLMASREDNNAFRLVHSHSGIVYKNFPVPGKKYGHLLSGDFSPLGGYLALGCSSGRAHLCRIPYYSSY